MYTHIYKYTMAHHVYLYIHTYTITTVTTTDLAPRLLVEARCLDGLFVRAPGVVLVPVVLAGSKQKALAVGAEEAQPSVLRFDVVLREDT